MRARLEGRRDDTEPVTRLRQQVYVQQPAPLGYARRGLLVTVDGWGTVRKGKPRIGRRSGSLSVILVERRVPLWWAHPSRAAAHAWIRPKRCAYCVVSRKLGSRASLRR